MGGFKSSQPPPMPFVAVPTVSTLLDTTLSPAVEGGDEDEGQQAGSVSDWQDSNPIPPFESLPIPILHESIPATLDTLLRVLASQTWLDHYFRKEVDGKEISMSPWTPSGPQERTRTADFTVPTGQNFGPKFTKVHEIHTLRYLHRRRIILDVHTDTIDVPYSTYFYYLARTVATQTSDCQLTFDVSMGVTFVKKTFMKGKIEKITTQRGTTVLTRWLAMVKATLSGAVSVGPLAPPPPLMLPEGFDLTPAPSSAPASGAPDPQQQQQQPPTPPPTATLAATSAPSSPPTPPITPPLQPLAAAPLLPPATSATATTTSSIVDPQPPHWMVPPVTPPPTPPHTPKIPLLTGGPLLVEASPKRPPSMMRTAVRAVPSAPALLGCIPDVTTVGVLSPPAAGSLASAAIPTAAGSLDFEALRGLRRPATLLQGGSPLLWQVVGFLRTPRGWLSVVTVLFLLLVLLLARLGGLQRDIAALAMQAHAQEGRIANLQSDIQAFRGEFQALRTVLPILAAAGRRTLIAAPAATGDSPIDGGSGTPETTELPQQPTDAATASPELLAVLELFQRIDARFAALQPPPTAPPAAGMPAPPQLSAPSTLHLEAIALVCLLSGLTYYVIRTQRMAGSPAATSKKTK
ncbi:hypothetical protein PAPYR_5228 [Paratrimastix pyriformis]|uniref:VASt domain-containing protein n=1 Tax=Paratrimastix pyriformis TaxID=342808 RepID=A0ABQ8UN80_9EUKA|nr:hypothetical protein PAPYR_5228 [Paratrimastix pyriformis]